MKSAKILFSLLLSVFISSVFGQVQQSVCGKYMAGVFFQGSPAEEIVDFHSLEYWISAHVQTRECFIYKITWIDDCDFILVYNSSIHEKPRHPARIHDSVFCSFSDADSTEVTYEMRNPYDFHNYYSTHWTIRKFTPIKDSDAWKYLTDADTLLYSDTSEVKLLYGLPLQNFYYNVPDFISRQTDTAETRFAGYLFTLLEKGDIEPAFDYATPVLKANSSPSVLHDYNEYIHYAFGKLKEYKVLSCEEISRAKGNAPPIDKYILEAKFEKVKQKVKLCISLARDYPNPLVSINIIPDSASQVKFIDTLTSPFWMLMKEQNYKAIYETSSETLKSKSTYEEAQKALTNIYNRGHFSEYKLFFQTFSVSHKEGTIIADYQCKINGKTLTVNLAYKWENNRNYKLIGVNSSEN